MLKWHDKFHTNLLAIYQVIKTKYIMAVLWIIFFLES